MTTASQFPKGHPSVPTPFAFRTVAVVAIVAFLAGVLAALANA